MMPAIGHRVARFMKHILFPLLLLLAIVRLDAQETTARPESSLLYWLTVGVGGADYVGAMANLTLGPGGTELFSLRGLYMEEFRICVFGCSTPPEYHADVGAMYGGMSKGKWGYASISTGLALTFLRSLEESSTGTNPVRHTTIGLPLDIQLFLTPLAFVGIGITATSNINPRETFAGIFLCLQFGSLR